MEIRIKQLILENFKGIRELTVDFKDETNIFGANATGKTTIVDAFTWLLFDKDSKDRKTFDIKTIDKDGNTLHMLDHSVQGTLDVDGKELTLKKTYKEQWTKKRGSATEEFTGHTTDYLINEVPVKKKDYDERISGIIEEDSFKLLTNPKHFSEVLDKKKRRETLLSLIDGDIDLDKIIEVEPAVEIIKDKLNDYTVDELEKMAKATIKKSNDELKTLPARIDELNKMLVDDKELDTLQFREKTILSGIKKLDSDIASGNNIEAIAEKKEKLYKFKEEKMEIVSELRGKNEDEIDEQKEILRELEGKLREARADTEELKRRQLKDESALKSMEKEISMLREEWMEVNAEVFDENSLTCPTCNREYDDEKAEEIKATFNRNKSDRLEDISRIALGTNTKKERIEEAQPDITKQIERLTAKAERLDSEVMEKEFEIKDLIENRHNEYEGETLEIDRKIRELESEIEELENSSADSGLELKKEELEKQLNEVRKTIAAIEMNDDIKEKIESHSEREKILAEAVESGQAIVYACEEYRKTVATILENEVNNIFESVDFKLFETQINGGITEACEALIDGVPYSSANNAAQINSGIEIINALSNHLGVRAPIFVDNAESVNKITKTDSPLITLSVSEDTELIIK